MEVFAEAVDPEVFCKKSVLRNFAQENTCARVYFLIKLLAAPATLLKNRPWHRCFPVNFAKPVNFYRTPTVAASVDHRFRYLTRS